MAAIFQDVFAQYPASMAPFLHEQFRDFNETKPLKNLRILHHVPVVRNCLLKIGCLVAAGAEVTITNPDFMTACPDTVAALAAENIRYIADMQTLQGEQFDIYLDCGAVLYTTLGAPRLGAVELTGTGDQAYRQLSPTCPVISIDKSLTKQLETVFGAAFSSAQAIMQLTSRSIPPSTKWVIFGFGKIGRGLAYLCKQHGYAITIIDTSAKACREAAALDLDVIDAYDINAVKTVIESADIVMTATGSYDVLTAYDKSWFTGKVLANMGILDEFGPRFAPSEILYDKMPINFALTDPTPIEYIDPELYLHNQIALELLNNDFTNGVHNIPNSTDQHIIDTWCSHHAKSPEEIDRWFIKFAATPR